MKEPLYENDNFEQAYFYIIKATNQEGDEWLFDVYQGCTGSAVGAKEETSDLRNVLVQRKLNSCYIRVGNFSESA